MKATELRIGNLVYHNNEIIEVKSLHPQDDDVNDEIPFDVIYGIKLTEEWLLKFGFEGWDIDDYTLILTNGNFFKLECLDPIATSIFYVHQLQNLYFALTGKELWKI